MDEVSDIDRAGDTDSIESSQTGVHEPSISRRSLTDYYQSDRLRLRSAAAFATLGGLALAGVFVLPEARSVLIALAGIGLFGAALLWYLKPSEFFSPATSTSVYAAFVRTGEGLVDDLDLSDERLYVPSNSDDTQHAPARLFVPAHADYELPRQDTLATLLVTDDDDDDGRPTGITVSPTGSHLYHEFRNALRTDMADHPSLLTEQVCDALENQFELATVTATDVEPGTLSITVSDTAYGAVEQFDHPVVSFAAVSLVDTLDTAVALDVTTEDAAGDQTITYRWNDSATN